MAALPYTGTQTVLGHSTNGRMVTAGLQAPVARQSPQGHLTSITQTAKASVILTSGVLQTAPMGNLIISPTTGGVG